MVVLPFPPLVLGLTKGKKGILKISINYGSGFSGINMNDDIIEELVRHLSIQSYSIAYILLANLNWEIKPMNIIDNKFIWLEQVRMDLYSSSNYFVFKIILDLYSLNFD